MSKFNIVTLILFFWVVFLLNFCVQPINIAWAKECPQTRKTQKAPESYKSKESPLRNEPRHIKKGKVLSHIKAKPIACKQCHGMQGDGNGAMALNMNPKPRNFTCKDTMDQIPDGQLFWIIKNGSKGSSMPSYKHLSDKKVWQLIQYIRSLTNPES